MVEENTEGASFRGAGSVEGKVSVGGLDVVYGLA